MSLMDSERAKMICATNIQVKNVKMPSNQSSTPQMASAVRAGIAEISLPLNANSPVVNMAAPSPAIEASPAFHRRVGRRVLRLLRPLALPFLARIQRRVSSGVDSSDTALRIVTILEQIAAINLSSARITDRLSAIEARLGRPRAVVLGDEVLTRTPFGWLLLPAEDLRLLAAMVETGGQLELGTAAVAQALLAPGDLAVDAGAHVGTLTLAMARSVGQTGKVFALEPTPRLAAMLSRSAAINSFEGSISVVACALGSKEGQGELATDEVYGHNSLLPLINATGSVTVPIRRLDDVLPPGSKPTLIKLDVEGFELEAWKGMAATVAASPSLSVIVEFGPSHLARAGVAIPDWIAAFTSAGFTPWEIIEETGMIRPLRKQGLDKVFSMNLLFLRAQPSRWPGLRLA